MIYQGCLVQLYKASGAMSLDNICMSYCELQHGPSILTGNSKMLGLGEICASDV